MTTRMDASARAKILAKQHQHVLSYECGGEGMFGATLMRMVRKQHKETR